MTRYERLVIAPPPPSSEPTGRRQSKAKNANKLPDGVVVAASVSNVYTCKMDTKQLSSVRQITDGLTQSLRKMGGSSNDLGCGGSCKLEYKPKRLAFHAERPNWKSDIRWVSADDAITFDFFQTLFDKLRIADKFSFLGTMRLFSGFFVVRQCTRKSHFHTDFSDSGGKAFTLMTPLNDMSDLEDCHLLAQIQRPPAPAVDVSGCDDGHGGDADIGMSGDGFGHTVCQYRYEFGTGIAFGDGFVHATETGASPRPLCFLCFTFGDKDISDEQWHNASAYISQQGPVYQDPWGSLVTSSAFLIKPGAESKQHGAKR